MKLSIIIVSWNVREKLEENLKAIFRSNIDFDFEVFVVDNNSADKTVEMVREKFPKVNMIANQENLGFAKANNQAIRQTKGEYVLLLNPDMQVKPGTLAKMIDWMDKNQNAWLAGCNLVTEKGETLKHVRRFPGFWDQLAIVLKVPHIWPGVLNKYLRVDFDYSQAAKVDSVRGGFFFLRRSVIDKLGGLDERYFLWFEEVDYCLQIREAGGEVWYTPTAECIDYIGQSFGQVKRGTTQKYFRDSMLSYFNKWKPAWQYYFLKLAWFLGRFIAILGETLNFKNNAKT